MYLLATDWHLDENSDNEYRWGAFDRVREIVARHDVSRFFHLGASFYGY